MIQLGKKDLMRPAKAFWNPVTVLDNVTRFSGPRREATLKAAKLLRENNAQEQLIQNFGVFIWKVEQWPNWLQIRIDLVGNASEDRKAVENWYEANKDKLHDFLNQVLENQFEEIAIIRSPMGTERHRGGCCRTGCTVCYNGPAGRLVSLLLDTQA